VVFTKGGFIVGAGGGEGVLTFRGHHYRFNVSGMSLGFTIGASTTRLTGHALNLRSPLFQVSTSSGVKGDFVSHEVQEEPFSRVSNPKPSSPKAEDRPFQRKVASLATLTIGTVITCLIIEETLMVPTATPAPSIVPAGAS